MKRHVYQHYESSFVDYLRGRGVPYVPVDETRRAIFAGSRIKSFDVLVYPREGARWIVDIKGRKFPYYSSRGGRRYWENWVERDDLEGLREWQTVFGEDFEACFIFAYLLDGPPDRWPPTRPHYFRGGYYAFYRVRLNDYLEHARQRSPSWQTLTMSRADYRRIARPVDVLLRSTALPQPSSAFPA